jgi:uncharacterized RDD family membrane protein YckC
MSNVPPPPPPGGGFPPPPPPGGGFPPPTPPGGGGFAPPAGAGFAGYAPTGGVGGERAGFWPRVGGWLIDGIIVFLFTIPGRIVFAVGPKHIVDCPDSISTNPFDLCEGPTSGTAAIGWTLYVIAWIGGLLYYSILNGRGATLGKKALNLRVVDNNTGQPIGTGRAVGRYFANILAAIPCLLGYFWMIWDDQKQTWQDKMVSSAVVRDQ